MGSRHVDDDALFSRQIDSDDPDTWKAVIHGHRVFVSTVSTFQNNWALLKEFVKFSEIIIDEASQLTEAAIAGILVLFDKFILIGDQKQLPAVVTQDKEQCRVEGAYMQQLGLTDLRVSLFERMVRNARSKGWRHAHEQLQDHYRMHTEIANLITTHYEGTLVAGTDGQKDGDPPYVLPSDHRLAAISAHRVVFIQAPVDHGIKKNEAEAKIAAELANTLIGEGLFRPDEIGIIAPFRAQVAAIKRHLDPKLALEESFVVDTVERYQGDERKLIIFSTTICRSGELNTIQSTWNDDVSTADRKLLVAISRAKQQFILLGNADALRSSPAYRQILDGIPALSLSH
jgi:superfamily I DNA and/or RNA helicase